MASIAAGLSHERRIQIIRTLLEGPRPAAEIQTALRISDHPFHAHMTTLLASSFATRCREGLQFCVPDHPLAKALAKLLRQGAAR